MTPFLSSSGGGLHDRLIDVDDRDTPVKLTGDEAGPVSKTIK